MSRNITLNSTNVIGSNNNVYKKDFINGGLEIGDGEGIFVDKLIIPNSICNITPALKNNYFAYTLPVQSTTLNTGVLQAQLRGAVTNSNIIPVSNTLLASFYVGYRIIIDGVTTSTPIIITAIDAYSVVNQTFTINQSITAPNLTTLNGFIVGNKILANVTAGVDPSIGFVFNPTNFYNGSSNVAIPNLTNIFIFSINIEEVFTDNPNKLLLFTLNYRFTTDYYLNQYIGSSVSNGYEILIPKGHYTITELNEFLQNKLIERGHYWWNKVIKKNYFPFSYEDYLTTYKCKRTIISFPSSASIDSLFGSNAYFNNPYLQNGNFSIYTYNFPTTTGIKNYFPYWGTPTLTGSMITHIANGIANYSLPSNATINGTLFSPSSSSFVSFIALASNPMVATGSLSQSVFLPSGNYRLSCQALKALSGASSLCRIIINGVTTDFVVSANNLNRFSVSFTQATSATISISIGFLPVSTEINGNVYGLTNCLLERTDPNFSSNIGSTWNYYQSGNAVLFENYALQKYELQTGFSITTGSGGSTDVVTYPLYPLFPKYGSSMSINNPTIYQIGYYLDGENSQNIGLRTATSSANQLKNDAFNLHYGFSLNPINGIIIKCNLVRNGATNQSNQTISFPLTYPFGSNNYYEGDKRDVMTLEKGIYNSITFELCDQYGNTLTLLDNNVLMNFIVGKINLLNL